MTVRIHLDTDLGSDTDDLCALAMLLGWPGAELVGVTTSTDPDGRRAGWARWTLTLAGRAGVPVESGAEGSLGGLFGPLAFPDYWPEPVDPSPSRPGAATDLLHASAASGAAIVAIGPWTNLAILEATRPGILAEARVVVMGGHVPPPAEDLPAWGSRDDWNVQQDALAARVVIDRCDPVIVPLSTCMRVALRAGHLDRLREAGALGALLASQAEAHARDHGRTELGRRFRGLPDDLLNFQYDPLACAVALGWDGVEVSEIRVATELDRDGLLVMREDLDGRALRIVTDVDGPRFEREWLDAVVRASRPAPRDAASPDAAS